MENFNIFGVALSEADKNKLNLSSIELNVSLHELNEVSREFVLDIKNFKGFTKGFLIESQNMNILFF